MGRKARIPVKKGRPAKRRLDQGRPQLRTHRLTLVPHVPAELLALLGSEEGYEKITGRRIANGVREFLLAASPEYLAQLKEARTPDPWQFGFAVVLTAENVVVGLCGFTGPPDAEGGVEIAYSTAPAYEGRGYATETATALIEFAATDERVRTIRAHTLPEINASTRVLEKCGLKKSGEVTDAENILVWRWEKTVCLP